LALVAYDEEDHRVAIVKIPGLAPKDPRTCGLHVRPPSPMQRTDNVLYSLTKFKPALCIHIQLSR
jgi:hypothetical protein